MSERSRREFLMTTGLGAVAWSTMPSAVGQDRKPGGYHAGGTPIPLHTALAVPGVHAYPREHSVAAGETLELAISASVPYKLSICRLGWTLDDSSGDEVLARFDEAQSNPQPIHPGSYIHCARGLDGVRSALTVECWVRPWSTNSRAGLLTQYDDRTACGVGLFLEPAGAVAFYLGDGGAYRPEGLATSPADLLNAKRWHYVVGTWDGREKALWIDGRQVGRWPFAGPVSGGPAPLRLAALGAHGEATGFLDGDLAMPAVYSQALGAAEIEERFRDRGLTVPRGDGVVACWPLSEERGDRVADSAGGTHDGRIINEATWMIGGPSFEAEVTRFGRYDPQHDTRRGHGLRFASDDLYDCRWTITRRWEVPATTRTGLYVARFEFEYEGKPRVAHVTFVVRRARGRPRPPILVLAATNTWRAYSGTPFMLTPNDARPNAGTGGFGKGDPDLPAFNLYRAHRGSQGSYQVGLRMPWPAAGPYVVYGGPAGYSHLARADRFAHVWLEKNGYDFDLISDLDLHRHPEILNDYRVVMINGHNEYWSLPMYQGLEAYLGRGGRLIVLSGDTMIWRVSFDPAGTVMECRKVDAPGFQVPANRRGEAWHSQDGLRGGMMRECGYPSWRLIGLESFGFNNPSEPENFGPYIAERTDHPFFRTPEDTGLKPGDRFAWAGPGRAPVANGHEFDLRPSTFAALQEKPSPEGGEVPADPPGIVRLANGVIPWSRGGRAFDFFYRPIRPKTDQGGEMIDWQRQDGGRVFNAGSIGSGWALAADSRWSALVRNVLHHFGVPRPREHG